VLLSMTGHGESHRHEKNVVVAVEVRTINNRFFKLSVRSTENYAALEPQIEDVVRQQVRRGTVQVTLRVDREPTPDDYQLNEVVLASYRRQLERMHEHLHINEPVRLETLLSLPGVVNEKYSHDDAVESEWPIVRQTLLDALANLDRMRRDEGKAMLADLVANCRVLASELAHIETRAPTVVDHYRARITDRLNKLLSELGVSVQPSDIVREVGLFADRSDISEEMVRLRSHLEQFEVFMNEQESSGRKLDFLIQEMFRETNTIGSKSNDASIARHVVEMKTAIERMREMIQNVE
jgi:uncharacterized protein (TIGR00255 family)